jgi:5-methylcytosine-specific restriction enzyme subunit McrC
MDIPIDNIYYLLCYAWNQLEEKDHADVGKIPNTNLVDLFAKVLISGMNYLRKRGMDRGYIDFAENSNTIRGKVNFNETIKRNLRIKAMAHCEFDRLSYNVLHNRLIKSTINNLVRVETLDNSLKNELLDIRFWLPEVEYIELSTSNFHRVRLNRNNSFYGFLLNICELIAENLLVEEKNGKVIFKNFVKDTGKMRKLFELFVYNFFCIEQSHYAVSSKQIDWYRTKHDELPGDNLPVMQTDISLFSEDCTFIIDTKFTPKILQQSYLGEKDRIRTGHLYQLFSYVINAHESWALDSPIRGMLLYPVVDKQIDLFYELSGHQMEIRTINLAQPWQAIHNDLLALVGLNEDNRFN